jgi:hypothetical protein
MKGNFYLIIITILIIAIFVSGQGCEPANKTGKDGEPSTSQLKQIRSGNDGLVMDFVRNVPPDQIYDTDTSLVLMVNVRNRGGDSVKVGSARFYVGGIDPNIVDFGERTRAIGMDLDADLPGKDELRGEEGETVLTFEGYMTELPEGTDVYEPNIVVTACYEYRTLANPIVCIDPNPFGTYTSSKACEPRTVIDAGGQGAPIAVTSVEQIPMKGKVQFKIFVKNNARGKAISKDKGIEDCTLIEPSDYQYVNLIDSYYVEASGLSLEKCQPEQLRLIDEKGVIICSFNVDESVPAYTTPLKIELNYDYMESTYPRKVRIINI